MKHCRFTLLYCRQKWSASVRVAIESVPLPLGWSAGERPIFSLSEETVNFRQIDQSPKTFVLVFQTGDELANGLSQFAEEQRLSAASFKAVGALSSVRLAWFSWETKKYEPSVTLDEQVELLSLVGDVALNEGKPAVHAHAVIGKKDGTAHGGHLVEAHIRPTCELVLTESPAHLQKFVDPESGLALIRL